MAVPVVTYSYNIVNWKISELKKLDTKTRRFLRTMYKMHRPKSDAGRLYVVRYNGGRGLNQVETSYKIATIGLSTFLKSSLWAWCVGMMPKGSCILCRKRHKNFFQGV